MNEDAIIEAYGRRIRVTTDGGVIIDDIPSPVRSEEQQSNQEHTSDKAANSGKQWKVADLKDVRDAHAAGASIADLANKYGRSHDSILDVLQQFESGERDHETCLLMSDPRVKDADLLSRREAAAMCEETPVGMDRLSKQGILETKKIGSRVYFSRAGIEQWQSLK